MPKYVNVSFTIEGENNEDVWLCHFVALLLRENVNYIQKKFDFLLKMEDMPLNPQSMIKIKVLQSW
jgi:hypothetical protein